MTLSETLIEIGRVALDLIYPPRCQLCDRSGTFLCDGCAAGLPRPDPKGRCEVCWSALNGQKLCSVCTEHPIVLTTRRSALLYSDAVRRLVHAFKFSGHSALAPVLGRIVASAYADQGLKADLIVPVPLTGRRQRERGFNQALLIAREASEILGLPVKSALKRTHFSAPQSRSASAVERWRNVEGVYETNEAFDLTGLRVLLIDDITTTGATLNAAGRVLLAAGAREVIGLTLARED